MALARALAVGLVGLDGQVVEVECDISPGLPGLSFTGRADTTVVESRDRIKAAMVNSAATWPDRRITVALLPADVPKAGSRFDLAVAVAVAAASGQVAPDAVADAVWIAELGLDGRLRPVRGVLPAVLAARRHGAQRIVVATGNAAEAALVGDVDVRHAGRLREVLDWLAGTGPALPVAHAQSPPDDLPDEPDLADVAGQFSAKRALEIAAAGAHHLFLLGSPGAGKTMMAERLPGLLPPLGPRESMEVTAVHSIAGLLSERAHLISRAPFQAPHHTASIAAMVGGGSHLARPGAISIAHHGVLFLDEAPEFPTRALDALRQPLESGRVVLHRQGGAVTYPARFQLVLAANPCACAQQASECSCSPPVRRRHRQRLSGPLMDRIDLNIEVERLAHAELLRSGENRERSAVVAERVAAARARSVQRLKDTPWSVNAAVPGWALRSPQWLPPVAVLRQVEDHLERGTLSARGFDRVLRIAWTIADLEGDDRPSTAHMSEALYFRLGQVQSWAA